MADESKKLSFEYNLLATLSTGYVAGAGAALTMAALSTIQGLAQDTELPKTEIFLLLATGIPMLAIGAANLMQVFREEEKLGLYQNISSSPANSPH